MLDDALAAAQNDQAGGTLLADPVDQLFERGRVPVLRHGGLVQRVLGGQ